MAKCPVCHSASEELAVLKNVGVVGIAEKYEQKISVCEVCDFVFTSNPIDAKTLNKFYETMSNYEYGESGVSVSEPHKNMIKRQYSFIRDFLDSKINVLDIGAADGSNLFFYKEKGHHVYGIEPSKANVKYAEYAFDVEMHQGFLSDYIQSGDKRKFDLVILSHVLEHVKDPKSFIEQISSICNEYVYIEVPSMDMRFVEEPFGSFFFEHLNYFTYESLSQLMLLAGYKAVKFSVDFNRDGSSPGHPVIMALWKKLEDDYEEAYFKHSAFTSKFLVSEYFRLSAEVIESIDRKIYDISNHAKVAVWGVGAHTSRLLGMTCLADKNIIKFYDSDEKKHRFTVAGRQITRFDINDIKSGDVDTIVISTYAGERSILAYLDSIKINANVVALYN